MPPDTFLDQLPPSYRSDELGLFLRAFETVFAKFESTITAFPTKLDPRTAPSEFLAWLAGWVGLTLRDDWNPARRRELLANIVPRYRERGTPAGLEKMIRLYLEPDAGPWAPVVTVTDGPPLPPHCFEVRITFPGTDDSARPRDEHTIRAIIDQEKPAHTYYRVRVTAPTIRLVSPAFQAMKEPHARRWELGKAASTLGTAGLPVPQIWPGERLGPSPTIRLASAALRSVEPPAQPWELGRAATTLGTAGVPPPQPWPGEQPVRFPTIRLVSANPQARGWHLGMDGTTLRSRGRTSEESA